MAFGRERRAPGVDEELQMPVGQDPTGSMPSEHGCSTLVRDAELCAFRELAEVDTFPAGFKRWPCQ